MRRLILDAHEGNPPVAGVLESLEQGLAPEFTSLEGLQGVSPAVLGDADPFGDLGEFEGGFRAPARFVSSPPLSAQAGLAARARSSFAPQRAHAFGVPSAGLPFAPAPKLTGPPLRRSPRRQTKKYKARSAAPWIERTNVARESARGKRYVKPKSTVKAGNLPPLLMKKVREVASGGFIGGKVGRRAKAVRESFLEKANRLKVIDQQKKRTSSPTRIAELDNTARKVFVASMIDRARIERFRQASVLKTYSLVKISEARRHERIAFGKTGSERRRHEVSAAKNAALSAKAQKCFELMLMTAMEVPALRDIIQRYAGKPSARRTIESRTALPTPILKRRGPRAKSVQLYAPPVFERAGPFATPADDLDTVSWLPRFDFGELGFDMPGANLARKFGAKLTEAKEWTGDKLSDAGEWVEENAEEGALIADGVAGISCAFAIYDPTGTTATVCATSAAAGAGLHALAEAGGDAKEIGQVLAPEDKDRPKAPFSRSAADRCPDISRAKSSAKVYGARLAGGTSTTVRVEFITDPGARVGVVSASKSPLRYLSKRRTTKGRRTADAAGRIAFDFPKASRHVIINHCGEVAISFELGGVMMSHKDFGPPYACKGAVGSPHSTTHLARFSLERRLHSRTLPQGVIGYRIQTVDTRPGSTLILRVSRRGSGFIGVVVPLTRFSASAPGGKTFKVDSTGSFWVPESDFPLGSTMVYNHCGRPFGRTITRTAAAPPARPIKPGPPINFPMPSGDLVPVQLQPPGVGPAPKTGTAAVVAVIGLPLLALGIKALL